VSQSTETV